MATIKEIADSLNLSSATVSRALRNDTTLSITPETKARIFMAAENMGYIVKEKKNIKTKPKCSFTVLHKQQTFRNQIDSSYYYSVRTGIEDACAEHSIVCNFTPLETFSSLQLQPDGIIIVGNYSKQQFQQIERSFPTTPMITTGIISYFPEKIDHITHSNYDSIHLALHYLFEKGHKKIGYLGIKEAPETELFGSRKESFIKIMTEHGTYRPEWIYESEHGKDRVERGYVTMKEWIEKDTPLPTAIFCANDPVALGAVKALYEANIRIPDDISIIAHDGSYPTQYSVPPLTTVDVHPYQLGYEAVQVLHQRILDKRKYGMKISLYPELLERESVKDVNSK